MAGYAQKRLIRKLDLELFLGSLQPQPNPQWQLEQYTISAKIAADLLYIAAYQDDAIDGRRVLDLGCGTGRLGIGAAFLGATRVVGVDLDPVAIQTAQANALQAVLPVELVNGDIAAITGCFDTVLQNPPFGVQNREADRAFLVKALEVGNAIYSLHNHPEVDERLIKRLKTDGGMVQVQPSPFLERFITKHNGIITAVYATLMTIPKMFDFHHKLKHSFIIDLYVIQKLREH